MRGCAAGICNGNVLLSTASCWKDFTAYIGSASYEHASPWFENTSKQPTQASPPVLSPALRNRCVSVLHILPNKNADVVECRNRATFATRDMRDSAAPKLLIINRFGIGKPNFDDKRMREQF